MSPFVVAMARAAATIVAVVPTLVAGSHGPWVGVIVSTLPFAEPTKNARTRVTRSAGAQGLPIICPLGRTTSTSFAVQRPSRTPVLTDGSSTGRNPGPAHH